jgi:5S rRNA maturation endonuclease (ribonuclease M5)
MLERCQEGSSHKVEYLSTHLREKEERIQQVLQSLIQESSKGIPIIVEGKKDVQTLKHLGVYGEIVTAKTGGKSLLDLLCQIEESGKKEVILLFDFDKRGKEWTGIIKQRLEKSKTKPNLAYWNELLGLVSKEVKDVEGLASYIETLQKKTGQAVL